MALAPATVAFVGFDRNPIYDWSLKVVREIALGEAGLVESSDPDIVVCSEDLISVAKVVSQFPAKTLRVLFNCELGSVDFTTFDYVIGWEDLDLKPRYARMHPSLRLEGSNFRSTTTHDLSRRPLADRGFCSFVATNGSAHPMRDAFVRELSERKRVESWGNHMNNSGPIRNSSTGLGYELEKIELESGYRFSIAIENGVYPGYLTEKVFSGVLAGAVPIFWGNPDVGGDLNLDRIFSLHQFENSEDAIDAVLELENNPTKLEEIVRQPLMTQAQVQRISQSRQEIIDLFLNAAEMSRDSILLRPIGTSIYSRETLLVSVFGGHERALRRNSSIAKFLAALGILPIIRRFLAALKPREKTKS